MELENKRCDPIKTSPKGKDKIAHLRQIQATTDTPPPQRMDKLVLIMEKRQPGLPGSAYA